LHDLNKPLGELQINYIARGVLLGLDFLHNELKVCHRDLKSANLLIGDDLEIKISKFVLSTKANARRKKRYYFIKSPHYMAPEVVYERHNQYDNPKSDCWSLGMICLEMAEKSLPFNAVNPNVILNEIRHRTFEPCLKEPFKWTEDFYDFVQSCLKRDTDSRLSSTELLQVFIHYI
jgi:serine/threonine protein kinase